MSQIWMKVLLEVLDDASQLLAALDRVDDLGPDTRDHLDGLLERLCDESTRLLRQDDVRQDDGVVDGPGDTDAQPSETQAPFRQRCRDWLIRRALEALAARDYDRALNFLDQGVQAFPDDSEFWNHLGLVHWERQDYDKAADAYNSAMAAAFPSQCDDEIDWATPANRAYLKAMEGRALCQVRLGRDDQALTLFDALANMDPLGYGGCRYMAGEIRHKRGAVKAAISDYRLGPVEPASLYNLGLALFEDGQTELAASTFIRAFVSNVHVVVLHAGRQDSVDSCVPGYLGSREYAADFVGACQDLWRGQDRAVEFMETCYDHPLVQAYLAKCRQNGGESVLEDDAAGQGQANWLEVLTDARQVDGLAESVVERFKS